MASGSIKGITIEIEGKTSGLVKSLKDVNKSLSNTQKALRTVNQALKLDPKNMQTLKTKQDLLNSAIEDTKKKLELEKQAAADAAEALEKGTITKDEYNTLQAEVAKTASELNKLEQEANETTKALDKMGKGNAGLDTLSTKLKEVGSQLTAVGDKISAVGEKMQKFGQVYTATVTVPIVAAGKAAVNAFNEVDDALDETIKKTGATGQEAEEFRGIVEKLATSTELAGASFDEVADAVGEVQTKFGLTGDSLEETSAQFVKFAKINNTDVATSVDKVQKTLAAFGLKGEDANKVMDALTKTSQKYGNQVDKLADGLVQNGTAFQELGLTVEQSIDIMGRFEKSGANSETVMQGFRKALKNATKDGKPLNEALMELENTIKNGKDGVDGLTVAYDIFGKSGDQIYGAIKNGTLTFEDFNATVEDTAGTVNNTFSQITDDGDNMTVAMNSLKLALSKVGESITKTLAPILTKLAEKLQEVAKWWDELDPKTQDMIIKAAMLAAALGPVIMVIGTVTSGVGNLISGIGGLASGIGGLLGEGGALAGIMTKLGIGTAAAEGGAAGLGAALSSVLPIIAAVVAAIAAISAAVVYLWNNNENFRSSMEEVWAQIQAAGEEILPQVQELFQELGTAISEVWDIIGPDAVAIISQGLMDIVATIQPILTIIINLFKLFNSAVNGDMEGFKAALGNIFSALGDLLVQLVANFMHNMFSIFFMQIGAIASVASSVLTNIGGFFSNTWNSIKATTASVWNAITSAVSTAVTNVRTRIQTGFSAAMNFIKSLPAQALSWGRDLISNFTSGIMEKMNTLKQKVSDMAQTIKSYLHFSEPDVGPLSDFNTYAPDMVKNFAQGIEKNLPVLQRATTDMAGTISESIDYTGQLGTINKSIQGLAMAGGGGQVVIQLDSQVLARAIMKQQQNYNYRSGGR